MRIRRGCWPSNIELAKGEEEKLGFHKYSMTNLETGACMLNKESLCVEKREKNKIRKKKKRKKKGEEPLARDSSPTTPSPPNQILECLRYNLTKSHSGEACLCQKNFENLLVVLVKRHQVVIFTTIVRPSRVSPTTPLHPTDSHYCP